jgi:hypothetical protein
MPSRRRPLRAANAAGRTQTAGQILVGVVAVAFLVSVLPVVVRGAPLRDDFDLCVNPRWNSGLGHAFDEIVPETGAVRLPGRLLQVALIAGTCGEVPFFTLILVPLILTLGVGVLLYLLLSDLGLPAPWPHIAVAAWLVQPLGTEAAVWAVDLTVPLSLLLALAALLAFRRGRLALGGLATVAAYGLVEHVIFALPVAVWLVAPIELRRRALAVSGTISAAFLAAYLAWPGTSGRTAVALTDRLAAIVTDLAWYAEFPAVGLGLHSIPLAMAWAFPFSLLILLLGTTAGVFAGPRLFRQPAATAITLPSARATALAIVLVLFALNIPLMTTLPHPDSARTFTPTWLVLSATVAIVGARIRPKRVRLAGGIGGLLAAGALLSIALSVDVRVRTADFTEASSYWLAERVNAGGLIAVCHVSRTAVEPAPAGDFAVHEFIATWSAEAALRYYTGRTAEIIRIGDIDDPDCDPPGGVDLVVDFRDLLRVTSQDAV